MPKNSFIVTIIGIALISCSSRKTPKIADTQPKNAEKESVVSFPKTDIFGLPVADLEVNNHEVQKNESLYLILDKFNFSPKQIYSITRKARDVIDVQSFRPGQSYRTYAPADSGSGLSHLVWQPNPVEYVVFDWEQDSTQIYKAARPLSHKTVVSAGKIERSLYETIAHVDATPLLAHKLAEIYAWQINFFGLRNGDAFNVLYDKKYIGDTFYGTGRVRAAEFLHSGKTYRAYHFSHGSLDGYFNENGESVQKALLKAPFKFNQRISSRFSSNRFHPILKRRMPHYGVDFAAPYGTPVLAVGDGRVTEARYRGANGNIIKITHNATYRTAYLHLKGFARGIHVGTRVEQGQVIGYVGSTGRSTGAHLDYRIYRNGSPVNPLTVELPSSDSVPDSLMGAFLKVRDRLNEQLQHGDSVHTDEQEDHPAVSQANI